MICDAYNKYKEMIQMKIEIDLPEIFESEDIISPEFAERIESAVVQKIVSIMNIKVNKIFDNEMSSAIKQKVNEALTLMIPDLIDREFTPVGFYGDKGKPTTVRNAICESIEKEMQWKDSSCSYEQSVYTRVVKSVVEAKLKEFTVEFNKTIDSKFIEECMIYAVNKIRKNIK